MRHGSLLFLLLASLAVGSSACTDNDESDPKGSDDPACLAGEEEPCTSDEGCTGTRFCVDGDWGACEPDAELCDEIDDACDDTTDGVGEPCTVGTGICEAAGTWTCDADTGHLTCDAVPGDPQTEICNGIDDDCDGTIDNVEGAGELCSVGTGTCEAVGMWTCDTDAGSLTCDATPADPQPETCNGLDDDCDGTIDNVEGLGEACVVGTGACQRAGLLICDSVSGGLVCDAVPGDPQTETCNDIDDDCDGEVDNVSGLDDTCTVGIGACQTVGNLACDLDTEDLLCDAVPGDPQTETCNGIDDDCDGTIDNVDGLGGACVVGTGACQRAGFLVCDPVSGGLVCDAVPGDPQTETCNGIDDDCDGTIDNITPTFAAAQSYPAVQACVTMAVGDIDGDGWPDIVCAPYFGDQLDPETRLFTYLNQGDGTFGPANYTVPIPVPYFRAQNRIGLVDVDGDGDLDIVATGEMMKVQIYINDGHGTFATPYEAFDFYAPYWHGTDGLLLEDIDGDGDIDIIATVGGTDQPDWDIAISLNDGHGNFGAPTYAGTLPTRALAILSRDLDGDGDRDFVVLTAEGEVALVRATGPGTYAAPTVILSDIHNPGSDPLLIDLDGDGYEDFLIPAGGERILLPGTATGFAPASSIVVPTTEKSVAAGQLDCDGAPEVIILAGNTGASLQYLETPMDLSSVDIVADQSGYIVRLVDVNLDGKDDVVIGSATTGVRVLLQN